MSATGTPEASAGQPLDATSVAVTRPHPELTEMLVAHGADVAVVELITIERTADDVAAVDAVVESLWRYDWLVVSSANGVDALADRLDGSLPAGLRVGAVGRSTAAAVDERFGRRPEFVPQVERAAGFVAEFAAAAAVVGSSQSVLVVQAAAAAPTLAAGLQALGHAVDVVTAYRSVARTLSADELDELRRADVVVVASGSACRAWVDADPDCRRRNQRVVAIGPTTAAEAVQLGFVDVVAAERPDTAALTDAVVRAARS